MNKSSISRALKNIAKVDKDVDFALSKYGYPAPRTQPEGFETFVNTIISQQLSAKAAQSIINKVSLYVGDISPENINKKRITTLKKMGLSERKANYIKALAKAIKSGEFNPEKLISMNDRDAIEYITKLHGFGEWSAEIYLMLSLQRKNIFPANDLALQLALQKLKSLHEKPTPKQARELVGHWAPWRSAGSLFLWHYYQQTK